LARRSSRLAALGGSPSRSAGLSSATISRSDTTRQLGDADYQRLLQFRTGLRRFLRWSERQARAQGLTPAQHQLLLAIRGHPEPDGPSIGEIAAYLLRRHHSAVGLVDRAEAAGMVQRRPDRTKSRTVRVVLTPEGARRLEALSLLHVEELARLARSMRPLAQGLDGDAAQAQS
jgi:DNA-binding MarR family transcriptional regulator